MEMKELTQYIMEHSKEHIAKLKAENERKLAEKDGLVVCKYCGHKFIPSLVAPVKDTCHACIMASL